MATRALIHYIDAWETWPLWKRIMFGFVTVEAHRELDRRASEASIHNVSDLVDDLPAYDTGSHWGGVN